MLLIFALAFLLGPVMYRIGLLAFQIWLAFMIGALVVLVLPFVGSDTHFIVSIAAFIGLRWLMNDTRERAY